MLFCRQNAVGGQLAVVHEQLRDSSEVARVGATFPVAACRGPEVFKEVCLLATYVILIQEGFQHLLQVRNPDGGVCHDSSTNRHVAKSKKCNFSAHPLKAKLKTCFGSQKRHVRKQLLSSNALLFYTEGLSICRSSIQHDGFTRLHKLLCAVRRKNTNFVSTS